jgi:hypothetical protein
VTAATTAAVAIGATALAGGPAGAAAEDAPAPSQASQITVDLAQPEGELL